jgi:hypothetical protein
MPKSFLIALASILTLVSLAGCAPSRMTLDCNARRTIAIGVVAER